MKIKGLIEDLKIKKKKNDSKNSKNISRTFSSDNHKAEELLDSMLIAIYC